MPPRDRGVANSIMVSEEKWGGAPLLNLSAHQCSVPARPAALPNMDLMISLESLPRSDAHWNNRKDGSLNHSIASLFPPLLLTLSSNPVMSTDSKSHVSSPVFHPDPIPVQVPISATSNIIVLLSDTVTHLSEDLTRARQDTAQAHYTLGQATQQHFAQYADVSGQRTVLQNQLNDCYTNIVGFLNLAAGYTHNIGACHRSKY